jgi:hypothetical protein
LAGINISSIARREEEEKMKKKQRAKAEGEE